MNNVPPDPRFGMEKDHSMKYLEAMMQKQIDAEITKKFQERMNQFSQNQPTQSTQHRARSNTPEPTVRTPDTLSNAIQSDVKHQHNHTYVPTQPTTDTNVSTNVPDIHNESNKLTTDSCDINDILTILSANSNSLKNKLDSLKFNIAVLKPHIIIIQETKLKRKSQCVLGGYKCFCTIRGDNGGGLLIA